MLQYGNLSIVNGRVCLEMGDFIVLEGKREDVEYKSLHSQKSPSKP